MRIKQSFSIEDIIGFKYGSQIIGRPKMLSHLYYVDGALIDTGHSMMRNHIIRDVIKLSVDQIYITHHHEDHTGNIIPIQSIHNCLAYAPKKCCELMKYPPPLTFAQKITWGAREAYSELIPKDDNLKTNKYNFQIIPVPGHSPDMVALYEPDKQWLFSADLFINTYIGYFLTTENIKEQIASIKKILQLDFKIMLCSHNPQLDKPKQKLTKKLNFLEEFYDKVEKLFHKGYTAEEIFKILELREVKLVKFLSGGQLSKLNMVKSVIRNILLN